MKHSRFPRASPGSRSPSKAAGCERPNKEKERRRERRRRQQLQATSCGAARLRLVVVLVGCCRLRWLLRIALLCSGRRVLLSSSPASVMRLLLLQWSRRAPSVAPPAASTDAARAVSRLRPGAQRGGRGALIVARCTPSGAPRPPEATLSWRSGERRLHSGAASWPLSAQPSFERSPSQNSTAGCNGSS